MNEKRCRAVNLTEDEGFIWFHRSGSGKTFRLVESSCNCSLTDCTTCSVAIARYSLPAQKRSSLALVDAVQRLHSATGFSSCGNLGKGETEEGGSLNCGGTRPCIANRELYANVSLQVMIWNPLGVSSSRLQSQLLDDSGENEKNGNP